MSRSNQGDSLEEPDESLFEEKSCHTLLFSYVRDELLFVWAKENYKFWVTKQRLSRFSVCLPSYSFSLLPCPVLYPKADLFGRHHLGSPQLVSIWVWIAGGIQGDGRQEEKDIRVYFLCSFSRAKYLVVVVFLHNCSSWQVVPSPWLQLHGLWKHFSPLLCSLERAQPSCCC